MSRSRRRLPKGYDGTSPTFQRVGDLLPFALQKIGERFQDRPDLVLASWADIVGPKLAPMTRALSFFEGVITVKVSNSTLHSLLVQHEKKRILDRLRHRFPSVPIYNVIFKLG
ncbi:MAG: DUF721 domain-containing protein [Parachlamydiales bacterium]